MNKVGFIGLGRIGKPMAINICAAGFDLTAYDLREEPVRELVRLGAKAAQSPQQLAEHSEVIAVTVVDDAQVEEVITGDRGVLRGARPGTIIAIHSTIFPETVRRLAESCHKREVHVIDAPMTGGETGAREKTLTYMVGGDQAHLQRCREVFETSASHIFHMGALGSGAGAKTVVQLVTCINMLAAHEAEALSERCGIDFTAMRQVLKVSSGQSFVTDHWMERFKIPDDPLTTRTKRTEVFQKSLAPAIEIAGQLGLSLSGGALAQRLLPKIMGIDDS